MVGTQVLGEQPGAGQVVYGQQAQAKDQLGRSGTAQGDPWRKK